MPRILIDTDPGQDIDDLLAILFALRRPELDIRAITTVTLPSDRRARLIKRLLRMTGHTGIPVAAGMDLPLRSVGAAEMDRQLDFARTMNHESFALPADQLDDPDSDDAVGLIIRTVEAHPGEVHLACIAPLTNIACALRRKPSIARLIPGILLMGGETALNRAEHNIAFDAVAADIVLNAGIPVCMGTWDITRRFVLGSEDCARFAASARPECRALAAAIEQWKPAQPWKPWPVMYDLFPMVHAFDRGFYTMQEMAVRIDLHRGPGFGMTIPGGDGPRILVSTGVREGDLRQLYLDTVL
jgi:purine nucleosidase/pyrimidine-specific ribonucleoside hydrolase